MKMQSAGRNPVSSASTVAANIDLLTEILIRLPVKPLICFKSVSKRWLSLISSSYFSNRHSRIFNSFPTGVFLHHSLLLFNPHQQQPDGESIYLLSNQIPLNPLYMAFSSVSDLCNIKIQQSCNGLLLLECSDGTETDYFVFNPTTKQSRSIPKVMDGSNCVIRGMALAFDPSKSPNYDVVCVRAVKERTNFEDSELVMIEIFSRDAGNWRVCGEAFLADPNALFYDGVFFNGSIFWVGYWGDSLYFNVEEELLHTLPMPLPTYNELGEELQNGDNRKIRHFGECCGHLNLIEIYEPPITKFKIYELDKTSLGWFVKFQVDVGHVTTVLEDVVMEYDYPTDTDYYNCGVLSIVQGEKDEDMFLVLHINGKLVRYNFGDASFTKLCDEDDCNLYGSWRYFGWLSHLLFIESLSCV